MPTTKSQSAEIVRPVIAELESSSLLKKLVKDAVQEAVSGIAARLEEQEGRVLDLEGKVKAQEDEIKRLKKEGESCTVFCSALEIKLDALEQQGRCNNIRILGVKESAEEIPEVAMEVGEKLGVKLTPADFDRCHRLGTSSPDANQRKKHRPLLVKFSSRRIRGLVMGARSKLKGTDIFLNDDLTPARQKLLYNVRHCPKVERSFSQEGRIFAGIKNTSGGFTQKLITCDADIAKL